MAGMADELKINVPFDQRLTASRVMQEGPFSIVAHEYDRRGRTVFGDAFHMTNVNPATGQRTAHVVAKTIRPQRSDESGPAAESRIDGGRHSGQAPEVDF